MNLRRDKAIHWENLHEDEKKKDISYIVFASEDNILCFLELKGDDVKYAFTFPLPELLVTLKHIGAISE